tara:strand:- start:15248 stop:16489 length:1242 start_codon:yes stop_codon:yes gene_type:complete
MGIFKSIKSFFTGDESEKKSVEKKELNIDKSQSKKKTKKSVSKKKLDLPKKEFLKEKSKKVSTREPLKKKVPKLGSVPKVDPVPEPGSVNKADPVLEPEQISKLDYDIQSTDSLDKGLEKTKKSFFSKLGNLFIGKNKVDSDTLDELEEVLITSDVGVDTTIKIIENIESRVANDKYVGKKELNTILKEEISKILIDVNSDINSDSSTDFKPYVIMVVGVNGVGKTTTIGKLAHAYKNKGKKVILGASDTFRAAAIEQLQIWADRVGVKLVKQQMGSDPASVAFDTLKSAKSQQADVVIIDTAGRLHNKVNLMNELAKIKRVMHKIIPNSPHEVLLILDGSTGQNAFEQAKQFSSATDISSMAITKLDGTAKGGVVLGISHQFKIPVKYIGIGEKIEDLRYFDPKSFVESFFR